MGLNKKTVLITGCSDGGIGSALARAFLAQGYHVFATLRNTTKAGSLSSTPGIEILELEVTDQESISKCAQIVSERTGGSLDVLINNAGAGLVMPLLDVDVTKARKLYDLNVWSILTMTQAFAPLLIKAKGCVCNISSIMSLAPFTYSGVYSSSKAAVTILSETLRVELEPLGVRVICGLLGATKTSIYQNTGEVELPATSYYHSVKDVITQVSNGELNPKSQPADVVARAITGDIVGGKSGRIWRGGFSSTLRWMSALLPYSVVAVLINNNTKLPQPERNEK